MSTSIPAGTGKKTRRGTTRRKTGETVLLHISNRQIGMVFVPDHIQKPSSHISYYFELIFETILMQDGESYQLFTPFIEIRGLKHFNNGNALSYTCKARHSRCDEKKPVCGNCERLHLHCRPFDFNTRSSWCNTAQESTVDRQAQTPLGTTEAGLNGVNESYIANGTLTDNEHEASCPITSPHSTWDIFNTWAVGSDSVDSIIPLPTSPSLLQTSTFHQEASITTHERTISPSVDEIQQQTVTLTPQIAHLLTVYQAGVATWMDIFDHTNSYQREVPRRCMTSPLLLNSVCAFTAKHLSLLPSGEIWEAAASHYYGESLHRLIRHLNSPLSQADALTATILLCSYEVIASQGQEQQKHFYGAMMLIRTHGVGARSLGMDRANFWIYIRHDITVALIKESCLQLNLEEWDVPWQDGLSSAAVEEDVLGNQLLWIVGKAINEIYSKYQATGIEVARRDSLLAEVAEWFNSLPLAFSGARCGNPDDKGFVKICFAVPAAGKTFPHSVYKDSLSLATS